MRTRTPVADPELKAAMANLSKALVRVLRAVDPSRPVGGAFRHEQPEVKGRLEVTLAGDRMFFRAGSYEIELSHKLSEAEEEQLVALVLWHRQFPHDVSTQAVEAP